MSEKILNNFGHEDSPLESSFDTPGSADGFAGIESVERGASSVVEDESAILRITQELKKEDYAVSQEYVMNEDYEVNGVRVNTNELYDLVGTLSPENYGITKEVVVDALQLSEYASDASIPPEARHKAMLATLSSAAFAVEGSAESTDKEFEQIREAREIVAKKNNSEGFSSWARTKGKKALWGVLATIGLGAAAPAFAGSNRHEDRAANTAVHVLGKVLGNHVEAPFRSAREVGSIKDRAMYASEDAKIKKLEHERNLSIKEKTKLQQVEASVNSAQMKFDVEYKMHKIDNPSATEEDFIQTKEGKSLYKKVLLADGRAVLDTEKIEQDSRVAEDRAEAKYNSKQERIAIRAERDTQKTYRNSHNRQLDTIGKGAGKITNDLTRMIFRR